MANTSNLFDKLRGLNSTRKAVLALLLILPAPLIGVSSSFYFPPITTATGQEIEIGKVIWAIAKIWLMLLPIVWLLYIDRGRLSWSPTTKNGILAGLEWSVPFAIIIFVTYGIARGVLIPESAKHQIAEMGITSPANFLIFASAMSLGNSLMEEYVWRWFVFSKFKVLVGVWPAILLSAFFFTVHHVVIVWSIGSLWLLLIGSVSIFIGGVVWAWLYNKYNSIWPGWICHVAADTAVMWVTWWFITS